MGSSATTSGQAPLLAPSICRFRLHTDDGVPVPVDPMGYPAGGLGLRRLSVDYGASAPDCTCCPLDSLRSDDPTRGSAVPVRSKPETCLLVARMRLPSLDGPGRVHRERFVAYAAEFSQVGHLRRVSSIRARIHEARHDQSTPGAMDRVDHLLDDNGGALHSDPPGSVARWLARAAQQGAAADQRQLRSIDLGSHLAAYCLGRVGSGQRCCWPVNADPLGGGREKTPVAHTDLLSLIAEVSAAFVGFSLVVGLLQPGQANAASRLSSMQGVAELGLIAAGGAILVLLLNASGVAAEVSWRASSGALALGWAVILYFALRRALRAGGSLWEPQPLVGGALACSGILLLAWNAISPGTLSGPLYLVALTLALADSAFLFIQAAFERIDGPPAA